MHPNTFLKTLWRNESKPQVFVAMSFSPQYDERYETVIKPAIEDKLICGTKLTAYRVDNSKTGDSILTDIADGIAHSRLVLADVSVIDVGSDGLKVFRNGNVMYEVGVALACRSPCDVLLIRDDDKRFLFDVSTIPHLRIDFSDKNKAILELRSALTDRLAEGNFLYDARIELAASSLIADEYRILEIFGKLDRNHLVDLSTQSLDGLSMPDQRGLDGLIEKGCVIVGAAKDDGQLLYRCTEFGYALYKAIKQNLRVLGPPNEEPK